MENDYALWLPEGLHVMHTLKLTNDLWTIVIVGVLAGAVMTSSYHLKRVMFGNRSVIENTVNPTGAQTGVRGQFVSTWQILKRKCEGQISDNDKRIIVFKDQRARANKVFRATYDQRVAELERRNIALKGKLNDYKGERGDTRGEFMEDVHGGAHASENR
jgi:hypothetical protein